MKTTLFNRLNAGLMAAVLCLSVLAGCAAKPQKELTRYSTIFYDVFDTVTQVIAYCESEEEFTKQMEALHADLCKWMTASCPCWSWLRRCTTPQTAS